MPIHDWTRVRSNRFHDFHQSWSIAIRNALNAGILPEGYFAMVEQKTGGPEPDVIALELNPTEEERGGGVAIDLHPPQTRFVQRTEAADYARKANRVTVRHPDGDVAAVIEIVSPGNKDSGHAIEQFTRKAEEFLRAGVHLLLIDLFPPGPRDPQGIHGAVWQRFSDEPFEPPADQPLTLVAYAATGSEIVAYIEPVAVGDSLPAMPVFLTAEGHVECPLESTYATAWEQFPAPLKRAFEG